MGAFSNLPVIDKRSYVDRYRLPDLSLDGKLANAYTIERSSGHSGGSYYWLRLPQEDASFPQYLEYAFVQFYGMDTRSTLVLITLNLGTWTSGEKMAQALRQVAASGKYPLTVMAPGTDIDETLEILSDLAPHYDQSVIVGYPPFVKAAIDEGLRRGVDWPSLRVKVGLGGEGYSEPWRQHVGSLIGVDVTTDLLAVSGGYGAADIGMSVGREYPATVMIRQLCMRDPALAAALFRDGRGRHSTLPSLLQYDPANCYIEDVDGELVFSVLSGIPLVRYNIHDCGGVIDFDTMMGVVRGHGHDLVEELRSRGYGRDQVWELPFFYVYGRSDGTVSIDGANIFPESIQMILSEARSQEFASFKISVETSPSFGQKLVVSLEHVGEGPLDENEQRELSNRYGDLLLEGLRRLNADFRESHDGNPGVSPVVRVHPRGTGPFAGEDGIKHRYTM